MYKNILLLIALSFFTGCGPKPNLRPEWYIKPPKDYQSLYATGQGKDIKEAKDSAVKNLREILKKNLDAEFDNPYHLLHHLTKEKLEILHKTDAELCDKVPIKYIKIEKKKIIKNEEGTVQNVFVLIHIYKKNLFGDVTDLLNKEFKTLSAEYKKSKNQLALKRYIDLKKLMPKYHPLASMASLKEYIMPAYKAKHEFKFLNNLEEEFTQLKNDVTIHVSSDENSQVYAQSIKKAITDQGLTLSEQKKSKDSLLISIKSRIGTIKDEFGFLKSKSVIEIKIYDVSKDIVASKEYIFHTKSQKSAEDTKKKSYAMLDEKIGQLGIFKVLGVIKR